MECCDCGKKIFSMQEPYCEECYNKRKRQVQKTKNKHKKLFAGGSTVHKALLGFKK